MKRNKGITLIALVITIIVLLILAGVSIAMLTGENGILKKAENASEQTRFSNAEEKIKISVIGSFAKNGKLDYEILQNNINQIEGLKDKVGTISENSFPIKVNVDGYDFEISDAGDVLVSGEIKWEEILKDATTPHPEQSQSNTTIAVGTDGKLVNMDLWIVEKLDEGYSLRGEIFSDDMRDRAYIGEFVDGQIQGAVPQYIKAAGDSKFYPVIEMNYTFDSCEELKTGPELPSTLIDLISTFSRTGIINAPVIPEGVKNMSKAFFGCNYLENVPNIPEGVVDMSYTFWECSNIKNLPAIPSSVDNMNSMLYNCRTFNGEITIHANPSEYSLCFFASAISGKGKIVLKGTSTMLEELKKSGSDNSDITIER